MKVRNYPETKIVGRKTIIRKLEERDLDKSLLWLKDPEVNKYLSQDFAGLNKQQEDEWYQFMKRSKNDLAFAIETTTGRYIGNCALHKINWFRKTAEFGIVIGEKNYWNKGYGTEAVKIVISYATRKLKLRSIVLNVYEYNKRAIKAYQKCGFLLKKILQKDHYYNRRYWDTYVMEYRTRV
ncbi:MAG: GNAT family N-acetyltransferase [Actinomycetota bacterium]